MGRCITISSTRDLAVRFLSSKKLWDHPLLSEPGHDVNFCERFLDEVRLSRVSSEKIPYPSGGRVWAETECGQRRKGDVLEQSPSKLYPREWNTLVTVVWKPWHVVERARLPLVWRHLNVVSWNRLLWSDFQFIKRHSDYNLPSQLDWSTGRKHAGLRWHEHSDPYGSHGSHCKLT